MSSNLDKFLEELQKEILSSFSETVIEHAQNPRNVGSIKDADGYAALRGQCGDGMQIWIKVKDDKIHDISFLTDGCGTTIASGSMVTELASGKSIQEALEITPPQLLDALDGLPEESVHCAFLAVNTLHEAIKNYQKKLKAE